MKSVIDYVLWLLFPRRCAVCNKLIHRGEHLCETCEQKIERINKVCKTCGSDAKFCVCRKRVYHFKAAASVFNHGDYSKQTVNNFKFKGNIEIADFLASEMVKCVKENFSDIDFDFITSVPMSRFKKFINGFNHSEILAKAIAKEMKTPYRDILRKIKNNNPQHKSNYSERMSNVKGAYFCESIPAKNVLLVDDIKTTGATLNECARELLFAGVENVYCVTAISNNLKIRC